AAAGRSGHRLVHPGGGGLPGDPGGDGRRARSPGAHCADKYRASGVTDPAGQGTSSSPGTDQRPVLGRYARLAALLDVLAVLAFVIAGRSSHAEGNALAGIATTAWPFLAGLL